MKDFVIRLFSVQRAPLSPKMMSKVALFTLFLLVHWGSLRIKHGINGDSRVDNLLKKV